MFPSWFPRCTFVCLCFSFCCFSLFFCSFCVAFVFVVLSLFLLWIYCKTCEENKRRPYMYVRLQKEREKDTRRMQSKPSTTKSKQRPDYTMTMLRLREREKNVKQDERVFFSRTKQKDQKRNTSEKERQQKREDNKHTFTIGDMHKWEVFGVCGFCCVVFVLLLFYLSAFVYSMQTSFV